MRKRQPCAAAATGAVVVTASFSGVTTNPSPGAVGAAAVVGAD